jgi:thiol-disulfide isomerase/thioredoxin
VHSAGHRRRLTASAVLTLVLAAPAAVAQPVRQGALAPEIDLPTLAGGHVRLSTLRGRPVVVTFWNTWCPPCLTEFPELVRVHRELGPAGLYVLGVNERDQEMSTKHVQTFVDQLSVPFDIALDKRGRSRETYLIRGMPTTVFVDSAGVVQLVHRGPLSREELDRGVAMIFPPR